MLSCQGGVPTERDRIVGRSPSGGPNLGGFLGRPPTGRRVAISEVAMFRVRDGRIAEQRVHPDVLSMQRQLGLVPGAAGQ
jgi:predicted ester cyclase